MKILNTFLFLILSFSVWSQTQSESDLAPVYQLLETKQYAKASKILEGMYSITPNDLKTIWLYAQVAHWNKQKKLSDKLFKKACSIDPNNENLKLDYARALYESANLAEALNIIKQIEGADDIKAEALLMEAHAQYWLGHINEAKKAIRLFKQLYPRSSLTANLESEINTATTQYFISEANYQQDNQPLKNGNERLETGKYFSWLLNPSIYVSNSNYTIGRQVLESRMSNTFLLFKLNTTIRVSAGAYSNKTTGFIGSAEIEKKIGKITLVGGINQLPYTGTIKSIEQYLVSKKIYAWTEYKAKWLSVNISASRQFFNDGNAINGIGGYALSKKLAFGPLSTQVGYGFGYANAAVNLFSPKLPVETLLANYNNSVGIAGIYNPYFTPKNQKTHSIIAVINYKPTKKITATLKGNYGLYATCSNPYLFFTNDSNQNIVIAQGFTQAVFHPYEISMHAEWNASAKLKAGITTGYQETFFYTRKNIGLSVYYSL